MKRLIREGEISEQVADVQARLRAAGIAVDDEHGRFGEATKRAVRAFQQQRGLLVDGIVGSHTWSDLVATQWRLGDRVLYLAHPPMRGDDIEDLQGRLNALGFDAGRQDGIYGIDTDRAVRVFQREYGLREDGLFGTKSHVALLGLRAERPATAAALREELRRTERAGAGDLFVVIDPGHGGPDRGDMGPGGAYEADLCWDLARLTADRLAYAGARIRFTRTETENPDTSERARRANQIDADLFLSLHLNAHTQPAAQGASTYYFPTSKAGEMLAESVQRELVAVGFSDCRAHARAYPVLRETRMPAVLVEPAFITNPEEEVLLEDPEFRRSLAGALGLAIARYYEEV